MRPVSSHSLKAYGIVAVRVVSIRGAQKLSVKWTAVNPTAWIGSAAGASAQVLAELAQLIDDGELEVPIAHGYPLEQVQDAYRELERRHTRGKIVLEP